MSWLDTAKLKDLFKNVFTIVLEVSPNDPFIFVDENHFDGFVVLDPTCWSVKSNVLNFPRPLVDQRKILDNANTDRPIIGSFGLSIEDKGFVELVYAVEKEFSCAIIKINVPTLMDYPEHIRAEFRDKLNEANRNPEVVIHLTNEKFTREELVDWCASNTLNAFFYTRKMGNGLSATTDQAIASGAALAISTNPTFRHLMKHVKPYPIATLKESIEDGKRAISQIREEWNHQAFSRKFEELLHRVFTPQTKNIQEAFIHLPQIRKSRFLGKVRRLKWIDFFPPIFIKLFRYTFRRSSSDVNITDRDSISQYSHLLLNSFSHSHEDLIIDHLLENRSEGFYVDIGANNPIIGNNTHRFYARGWNGINVEPNPHCHSLLMEKRPRDINLQVAASDENGFSELNYIGDDTSITSLSFNFARKMAAEFNSKIYTAAVETKRLATILEENKVNHRIDFLSIDAEGSDLKVLKGNDWNRYRPTLVIVEANKGASQIIKFMENVDYIYLTSNSVNAFFMDKNSQSMTKLYKVEIP